MRKTSFSLSFSDVAALTLLVELAALLAPPPRPLLDMHSDDDLFTLEKVQS